MKISRTLCALCLLLPTTISLAQDNNSGAASSPTLELRQVHVVTRHGARFPLTKHAESLQEGTSGQLTPTGLRQMYDLGVFLRDRYGDFLHSHETMRLTSSSLDRTILSAHALTAGLFASEEQGVVVPGTEQSRLNVPVYMAQAENDVTIRAYDKCNRFLRELEKMYESVEWQELEAASSTLLTTLGQIPSFAQYTIKGKVPLKDVWNVYDAIFVAKTECSDSNAAFGACDQIPNADAIKDALSDNDWTELQSLVHQVESIKYMSSPQHANYVGGNLLRQIVGSMEGHFNAFFQHYTSPSFYLYSAHYPTLLGLFGMLGDNPIPNQAIPSFASALILEFYQDTSAGVAPSRNRGFVKLFYRTGESLDGNNDSANQIVGFDKTPCPLDQMCSLQTMDELLQEWDERRWCESCENHSADVCLLFNYYGDTDMACNNIDGRPALVGLVSGLLIGALGMICCNCWMRKRRTASAEQMSTEQPSVQIT